MVRSGDWSSVLVVTTTSMERPNPSGQTARIENESLVMLTVSGWTPDASELCDCGEILRRKRSILLQRHSDGELVDLQLARVM